MTEGDGGVKFYRRGDAPEGALQGETVGVIGYGNLGRSMALNLRDSGVDVRVGNIDDPYRAVAARDGFEPVPIADVAAACDILYLLIPDEVMDDVYRDEVAPGLAAGNAMCFASGYALAYGLVPPPPEVDVLLLAPRMLGEEVRHTYESGDGFFTYVSVEQDATGRAWQRLLGLADAVGSLRKGAMQLSADKEATLDLLIEQTVGPYLGTAIQLAFQLGADAGLPPEALVLEMYMSGEMARTFQTFAEEGFYRSTTWHGAVAQYGGFLRTLSLDREAMARHFAETLEDIRSGGFAKRFHDEKQAGYPTLQAIAGITSGDDPMTAAEQRVRDALG